MSTGTTCFTRQKRLSTLKAQAALLGACLYEVVDDHGRQAYLLTRGAITTELPSLDALEASLHDMAPKRFDRSVA